MAKPGQGFALDPPKAGGLWKPFYFHIFKVQGVGPWWVQGGALTLLGDGSSQTMIGIIKLQWLCPSREGALPTRGGLAKRHPCCLSIVLHGHHCQSAAVALSYSSAAALAET